MGLTQLQFWRLPRVADHLDELCYCFECLLYITYFDNMYKSSGKLLFPGCVDLSVSN